MIQVTFTSEQKDVLVIDNNIITVTNKFGDTYTGILQSGKIKAKSAIALSYLTRAYNAYSKKVAEDLQFFSNRAFNEDALNLLF